VELQQYLIKVLDHPMAKNRLCLAIINLLSEQVNGDKIEHLKESQIALQENKGKIALFNIKISHH
jgi:hypothetical protein